VDTREKYDRYVMTSFTAGIEPVAIGEARGLELMLGVELVTDRERRTPAALAREVRRYCREHGVLVGVGGSEGNVVRIQPPLVISQADLDEALDVIGAGIESLSAAHAG
jgi:4-aminobutyrate aminotransferase-like enzyme